MQSGAVNEAAQPQPVPAARAGAGVRLRGALIAAPCVGIVVLSFCLTPRKVGYGTHEELGLPACSFLQKTGYPCPSCGLTTSFAAMARGDVAAAAVAHPFGAALFVVIAVVGAVGLAELVSDRDVLRRLRPGAWWAIAAVAGLLLGWGAKIALGLANGTLPVR
jgi:sugar phosphate permease